MGIDEVQNFYNDLLIIELSILYVIGVGAFLLKLPHKDIYSNYRVALRLYGGAVLLWAICLTILLLTQWWVDNVMLARAVSISSLYIIVRLLAGSFTSLLYIKQPSNKVIIFLRWMIINSVLTVLAINLDQQWAVTAIHIINALAAFDTLLFAYQFNRIYKERISEVDNYFSEDINGYIKWIRNATYVLSIWLFVGYFTYPLDQSVFIIQSLVGY